MDWIKIRSWHAVRTMTRGGNWLLLCGRSAPGDTPKTFLSAELPSEKSCESCLRIVARMADAGS